MPGFDLQQSAAADVFFRYLWRPTLATVSATTPTLLITPSSLLMMAAKTFCFASDALRRPCTGFDSSNSRNGVICIPMAAGYGVPAWIEMSAH